MTVETPATPIDRTFTDLARGKNQALSIGLGLAVLAIVAGIVALTDVARHEVQPEGL